MYGLKEDSRIYQLRSPTIKIGRHTSNNIVLKKSLKVSRYHAIIRFIDNKPFIKDISSSEWGTYIGSHRILPDREIALKVGDILGIGSPAAEDQSCALELVFIEEESQKEPAGEVDNLAATQMCDSTRDIETIDITEPEIIEIEDEERARPDETASNIQHNRQVNVNSDNVTSSNETNIRFSPKKAISFKTPLKNRNVFEISDEEDEESKEPKMKPVISEQNRTTTTPINKRNRFLDVTPTMNGLLKAEPEIPPNPTNNGLDDADELTALLGFTSPVPASPVTSRHTPPETNNQMNPVSNIKLEYIPRPTDTEHLLNYSMLDEIISLDSDEEDFPSSQLNTTVVADAADYSSAFNILYEIKSELEDYEEDVKHTYNDSWFEPLSQNSLKEDLLIESSKNYRKHAPLLSNDVVDLLLDEPLELNEEQPIEPTPKEQLSPKFHKPPIKSPKIPIIDAPHAKRHKRRVIDEPSTSKKPTLREEAESEKIYDRLRRKENKSKRKQDKIQHSLSVEEKQKRKEKLREIAQTSAETESRSPRASNKDIDTTKVKVTNQNRGAFLTELPAESSTKKDKSERKPEESTSKTDKKHKKEKEASVDKKEKKDRQSASKKERKESTELSNKSKEDVKVHSEKSRSSSKPEISVPLEYLKHLTPKLPESSYKTAPKSILKKKQFRYAKDDQRSSKNKFIKFSDQNYEYMVDKWIGSSGFFAPYRKNEVLIREGLNEFESALATVCSWNVKWLKEQQNQLEDPPLYRPTFNGVDLIKEYKHKLKIKMFHTLWRLIFNAWNLPERDELPHTQFVSEDNYVTIERVSDVSKPDKSPTACKTLWTIYAKRELRLMNAPIDIMNGTLVILNFYVTKYGVESRIKTMGFAYVASSNRVIEGNRACDKIVFKIFGKPFKIEHGTAKMKILTYTKTQLRQFQALGMNESSPIVEAICSPVFQHIHSCNNANLDPQVKDKFLDFSQKKAVSTCLYSIKEKSPICLIDGPSGTGKTQVIVSLLNELFSPTERPTLPDKFKILIVTYCDKDADDLLYRIETRNRKEDRIMRLLRFGNSQTVHQSILYCTIEKQMEDIMKKDSNLIDLNHEKNNLLAKINSAELVLESRSAPDTKRVDATIRLESFKKELDEMLDENSKTISQLKSKVAKENVIANADVVITTLNSCWSSNFENVFVPTCVNRGDIQTFNVCIFDDANLFNEAALLIPQVLQVPNLILVGDQQIVRYHNEESAYHRLLKNFAKNNKDYLINLEIEHRLHPEVLECVKTNFKFDIKPTPCAPKRRSNLKPFVVIDYKTNSTASNYQINLCEKIIRTIGLKESDDPRIGFIVASNEEKESVKKAIPPNTSRKIIVELLDGYSAREQDIVVLFLPAIVFPEWLYIGITRPKSSLIICGDFDEIQLSDRVKSLVEESKKRKVFFSLKTNPYPALLSLDDMKKILVI